MNNPSAANTLMFIARSYEQRRHDVRRLSAEHRTSDATRLVWFVAICGYVLVNGVAFLQSVLPPATPTRVAWLFTPWAVAAIAALSGHIAISHAGAREDLYHIAVLAALDEFFISASTGTTNGQLLEAIVAQTERRLQAPQAAMDRANRIRATLTQTAQWAMLVSFAWSLFALLFHGCVLP